MRTGEELSPGSFVVVHLRDPTEKYWGALHALSSIGVVLRGVSLTSFEDWLAQVASGEPPTIGVTTLFVPMGRVERIFLDETSGAAEGYRQRFERRVGRPARDLLGGNREAPPANSP